MKLSLAFLVSVLSLFCMPAVAQDFKAARFPNGATVELHQRGGACPAGKLVARWISWDKVTTVGGCYAKSDSGSFVTILWDDGDESVVAEQVFKAPGGV